MKAIAKLLALCLFMTCTLSVSLPAGAATAAKTTQEKAQTLNAIKILSGTNGEYNLNNKLSRSEAATFIVRTVGKGNHVLEYKALYSVTPFSDVLSNQWYAPYIGYCAQFGFISNTPGLFKPSDYINEKDFLKLVLTALDYQENVDYTADKIYDKAYELGIISLNRYVNNYYAPPIMTRGAAVETLYAALSTNVKSGDKKLYRKLVDEGVVTAKQVVSAGLLVDSTITAIDQIKSKDIDQLEIKFNEPIVTIGEIKIYSQENNSSVSYSIKSLSGDTLTLLTSAREAKKQYIIELIDVEDKDGVIIDKLISAFVGYEPQEINSDFFKISKIEAVNSRSLKVFFTHPITINSEVCIYYSILKDNTVIANGEQGHIKAGMLNSDKNGILLTLDSDILNNEGLYTLNISGNMISAYGVKLNSGMGDSMRFISQENEDSRFALKEIKAVDKKTILLSFNKEVNSFLAKQIFNFYLTDDKNNAIRISSTAVDATGCKVYLNLEQEVIKGNNYLLTINNLNDITKQEYITETAYALKADYGTVDMFDLTEVEVLDNQTIVACFNKPLDHETAMKLDYYTLAYYNTYTGLPIDKVLHDSDNNPNKVTLFLSKSNQLAGSSKEYELRINSSMKDYLGNKINTAKHYFNGTSTVRGDNALNSVVPISTDAVKVTFTREIAFGTPNILPANYTLEYTYNNISIRKVPISVMYIDAKTLILKFDTFEYDMTYKLKIANILDYTGSTVKGLTKDFQLKAQ